MSPGYHQEITLSIQVDAAGRYGLRDDNQVDI
jgi:hypothetical protein